MPPSETVRGGYPPRAFYALSGLDRARALSRGEVPRPPISHLTGWRISQVGTGTATLSVPASAWLRVPNGLLDVPFLMEAALSCAAMTGAPPGVEVRTATLSVNHLRPCTTEAGSLIARARIINTGRTFTFCEAVVEDGMGRGVAHGTASLVSRRVEPPPPDASEFRPVEPARYATPDPCELPVPEDEFAYSLWDERDGLTVVKMMAAREGGVVPYYLLTGMTLTDGWEGACVAELEPSEWISNWSGSIATGILASHVSAHLAGATLTLSPGARDVAIIDQSMSFLRDVPPRGGPLVTRAHVSAQSEEFVVSVAEMTDQDGNTVALGYQTAVLRQRLRDTTRIQAHRELTTILFTDIVDSTPATERVGDAQWVQTLEEHNTTVRRQLQHFRGREVKTIGDGFLAVFDSPARAVQCARAIRDAIRRLGIEVRAGVHTGECEFVGDDISGLAVVIAKRIESAGAPGEILVSSTVRDLVVGSGLRLTEHGVHTLKGVEGEWRLYSV